MRTQSASGGRLNQTGRDAAVDFVVVVWTKIYWMRSFAALKDDGLAARQLASEVVLPKNGGVDGFDAGASGERHGCFEPRAKKIDHVLPSGRSRNSQTIENRAP